MSFQRVAVIAVTAVGFLGSPSVRAEVPSAPTLWDGRIVAADGRPVAGELVAYARPTGLGLDEGSAPLREIARTRTDGSGRYEPKVGGSEPGCDPRFKSNIPFRGNFERDEEQSTTYEGAISAAGFVGSVTTAIGTGVKSVWYNDSPRTRQLCGERASIASTKPTRIRSLP